MAPYFRLQVATGKDVMDVSLVCDEIGDADVFGKESFVSQFYLGSKKHFEERIACH